MNLDTVYITKEEMQKAGGILDSKPVSTAGKTVVWEFESEVSKFLKSNLSCMATNSGTSALRMILMMNGVSKGFKVAIPALRYIALDNVLTYLGAEIEHIDVNPKTWLMDLGRLSDAEKITHCVPVHLYGNPCVMDPGHTIIFDACQALGSKHNQEYVASWRNSALSFNGNKMITTGAGGMVFAGDDTIAYLKAINNQGRWGLSGFNDGMPALNAAIGITQMRFLERRLYNRKEINNTYRKKLDGIVSFQEPSEGSEPNNWYSPVLFENPYMREVFQSVLKLNGIPYRRIFEPPGDNDKFPNAWHIYDHGLCLPVGPTMTNNDLNRVCAVIGHAYDAIKHMSHHITRVERIVSEYRSML